ncbi:hypothetical protein TNCT_217701 [Trichonephila clavata]|uniref:Uncharacterized protein n=1 Tax=Trichonephila clavata TaxID=2740835 RepID=A0A8X6FQK9_TRICU|nr:hypothetical protein TNCT_217701 [Trichonephila clavata]
MEILTSQLHSKLIWKEFMLLEEKHLNKEKKKVNKLVQVKIDRNFIIEKDEEKKNSSTSKDLLEKNLKSKEKKEGQSSA